MTQIELAVQMDQLLQAGLTVFLKLEPEVVDFTQAAHFKLIFSSKTHEVKIDISGESLVDTISLIKTAIFGDKAISVICWNIKNLFTYILSETSCEFEFECKLFDLKLAECFVGVRDKAPSSFDEAVLRTRKVLSDTSWPKFKNIYHSVYLSLLTRVIPRMETEGVFDTGQRKILFPYYEIEGEVGGRLACHLAYKDCFNPHSLSDEEKLKLQPKGSDLTFLCFDYHFHEVCILAWLSKDEVLGEMVFGEGDFYKKLYERIIGECDSDSKRSFCKNYLFLPVIYGQSAKTLSERTKITITAAEKLIFKLRSVFSKLFVWIENYSCENNLCIDYIGRKRQFAEGEEYKYRNFIIQSPGAIFCLEKLVSLHNQLSSYGSIAVHIRDGYVVRCSEKQVEIVKSMCLKVLEGDSILFPGLKLRTNFKISKTLA